MSDSTKLKELGEKKLIRIIEDIIFQKTGNYLLKDDSFFYKVDNFSPEKVMVFNSDMFVSTTDAPKKMTFYQMGRKAILMNISDLVVKGVHPVGAFISIGLPPNLDVQSFREIIEGMVDYCRRWNISYIGGDMNMTNEIIINPTVFGFEDSKTESNGLYLLQLKVHPATPPGGVATSSPTNKLLFPSGTQKIKIGSFFSGSPG